MPPHPSPQNTILICFYDIQNGSHSRFVFCLLIIRFRINFFDKNMGDVAEILRANQEELMPGGPIMLSGYLVKVDNADSSRYKARFFLL